MTRKFKTLGLALFATLAMGAVLSSTASATEFTSASYPVTYSGTQAATELHVFKMDGFETSCKNAEFSGTSTGASTTLTLTSVYSECTTFGLNGSVKMNGCDYLLHLPSGTGTDVLATTDLVCPAGKDVTIEAGGGLCVVHVAPFTGKNHVTVTNQHPGLKLVFTVGGITASLTDAGGFFCPFTGNTSAETTYTGNLTLSGSTTIDIG
ncbi:MAG TPA: hypothetical protein VGV69_08970 [Solirubrobacterales bacterium]|nr:hypothetical protein [Solirubrobacterales bacterium]